MACLTVTDCDSLGTASALVASHRWLLVVVPLTVVSRPAAESVAGFFFS